LLIRNSLSSKVLFIFASPTTGELKLGSPELRDRLRDLLLDQFSLIGGEPLPNFSHLFRRWDFEIVRHHAGRSHQSPPGLLKNPPTDEDCQIGCWERADQLTSSLGGLSQRATRKSTTPATNR
jgi:hypothetical protein